MRNKKGSAAAAAAAAASAASDLEPRMAKMSIGTTAVATKAGSGVLIAPSGWDGTSRATRPSMGAEPLAAPVHTAFESTGPSAEGALSFDLSGAIGPGTKTVGMSDVFTAGRLREPRRIPVVLWSLYNASPDPQERKIIKTSEKTQSFYTTDAAESFKRLVRIPVDFLSAEFLSQRDGEPLAKTLTNSTRFTLPKDEDNSALPDYVEMNPASLNKIINAFLGISWGLLDPVINDVTGQPISGQWTVGQAVYDYMEKRENFERWEKNFETDSYGEAGYSAADEKKRSDALLILMDELKPCAETMASNAQAYTLLQAARQTQLAEDLAGVAADVQDLGTQNQVATPNSNRIAMNGGEGPSHTDNSPDPVRQNIHTRFVSLSPEEDPEHHRRSRTRSRTPASASASGSGRDSGGGRAVFTPSFPELERKRQLEEIMRSDRERREEELEARREEELEARREELERERTENVVPSRRSGSGSDSSRAPVPIPRARTPRYEQPTVPPINTRRAVAARRAEFDSLDSRSRRAIGRSAGPGATANVAGAEADLRRQIRDALETKEALDARQGASGDEIRQLQSRIVSGESRGMRTRR
jgi:hypothetical protein